MERLNVLVLQYENTIGRILKVLYLSERNSLQKSEKGVQVVVVWTILVM